MIALDNKRKCSKQMRSTMLKYMLKSLSVLWILLGAMTYADAHEEVGREGTYISGLREIPLEDSSTFSTSTSDSTPLVIHKNQKYGSFEEEYLPSWHQGEGGFMLFPEDIKIEISYSLAVKDLFYLSLISKEANKLFSDWAIVRGITWKIHRELGGRIPLPSVSTGNDEKDHKIVDLLYVATQRIKELEKAQKDDSHLRNLISGFYDSLRTDVHNFIDDYEPRLTDRSVRHHTYEDKIIKLNYLRGEWKEGGFFDCCQISNMICKHDCDNCFFDMKDRDDHCKQSCQNCCESTGNCCASCFVGCLMGTVFICFTIFKPCCCPNARHF